MQGQNAGGCYHWRVYATEPGFLLALSQLIPDYFGGEVICGAKTDMASVQSWAEAFNALGLTDEVARDAVRASADIRIVAAGASIIAQDEVEDHVFLLLNGRGRVVLLSESGQEIWLDTLEPGTIIGELAALTDRPRTSEIIAETDCRLASFGAGRFLGLMQQHGDLGLALSRILARRVHHTTQRMFELSALSAPGRIYAEILRMSVPSPDSQRRLIQPVPSLTALAVRVNTTRETVSRTVSDLEKRGLLQRMGDSFELVDPDQLARLQAAG